MESPGFQIIPPGPMIIGIVLDAVPGMNQTVSLNRYAPTGLAESITGGWRGVAKAKALEALAGTPGPDITRCLLIVRVWLKNDRKDLMNVDVKNILDGFQDAHIILNDRGVKAYCIYQAGYSDHERYEFLFYALPGPAKPRRIRRGVQ